MITEFYEKIGGRIRQLREDKGWSMNELIDQIRIMSEKTENGEIAENLRNTSIISRIENGHCYDNNRYLITNRQLETFKKVFGVTKGYLIYGDDDDKIDLIGCCYKELEPKEDRKMELLRETAQKNNINLNEIYEASKEDILKTCKQHIFKYRILRDIDNAFVEKVGREIIFYMESELINTVINTITMKINETINSGKVKTEKITTYTTLLSQWLSEICTLISKEIDKKATREKANILQAKIIKKLDELKDNL